MRSTVVAFVLCGSVFAASASRLSASDAPVACGLLTQAAVGAATRATVGAGSAISSPTSCQWSGQGKIVTLTINQVRAGKSPVDQFNDGKANKMGIPTEPVGGVGDDAYYVYFPGPTRAGCGLVVKKGSSVFEIRVYGFELGQAKTVAKTLAQAAAGKF